MSPNQASLVCSYRMKNRLRRLWPLWSVASVGAGAVLLATLAHGEEGARLPSCGPGERLTPDRRCVPASTKSPSSTEPEVAAVSDIATKEAAYVGKLLKVRGVLCSCILHKRTGEKCEFVEKRDQCGQDPRIYVVRGKGTRLDIWQAVVRAAGGLSRPTATIQGVYRRSPRPAGLVVSSFRQSP
jgi:hypothetical protein